MKKRNIIVSIIILMILFIKIDVNAATTGDDCSTNDLSIYRLEANNVSITHELFTFDPNNPYPGVYYYDIIVSNITDNVVVTIKGFDVTSKSAVDGEIRLEHLFLGGGYSTPVVIKTSSSTKCPNRVLVSTNYKIPTYNRFNERKECDGYEEILPICKKDTNVEDVEDDQFLKVFEKQKLEYEKANKTNKNKIDIFDWYLKNKKITIPITIGTIVLAAIIIIVLFIRNKKKIKVNLGGEI